jgi:hypothetical protein
LKIFHLSHDYLAEAKRNTCRTYTITINSAATTITIDIGQFGWLPTIWRVCVSFLFFSVHTHAYTTQDRKQSDFLFTRFFLLSRSLTLTIGNKTNELYTRHELITVRTVVALRLIPRCCCFFYDYRQI